MYIAICTYTRESRYVTIRLNNDKFLAYTLQAVYIDTLAVLVGTSIYVVDVRVNKQGSINAAWIEAQRRRIKLWIASHILGLFCVRGNVWRGHGR